MTTTVTFEKREALHRAGLLPAAALPEVLRCEAFGHVYSLEWMDTYDDRAHAERIKAHLLALVGTLCGRCVHWRRAESAAWHKAKSIMAGIESRESTHGPRERAARGRGTPGGAGGDGHSPALGPGSRTSIRRRLAGC